MIFPTKVPGLRWLTILTAVYGIIWMSFEGDLRLVTMMGTAVSLTVNGYLMQRFLGGWPLQFAGWLVVMGTVGLLVGFGSSLLTLVFMAIKTGLHGHGPEFQPPEIEQIVGLIPLWGAAGLVAGLGMGVLIWGFKKSGF